MCYNIAWTLGIISVNHQSDSNDEVWLSLVERCVRDAEAAGSNPVTSTTKKRLVKVSFFILLSWLFVDKLVSGWELCFGSSSIKKCMKKNLYW